MKKILLLSALFFYCLNAGYGQAGRLDSSYGHNGIVKIDAGAPYTLPVSRVKVLLANDGSFFNISTSGGQSGIVQIYKRNPNGLIDQTYGHKGVSDVAIINGYDAVMQPDGKIIVAGTNGDSKYPYSYFEVARYNTDGSLDTAFGSDGYQYTDLGAAGFVKCVALQNDGKILLGGSCSYFEFALVRYNSDGSLDESFNKHGIQFTSFFYGIYDTINSVVIQKDGKIIAAGVANNEYWHAVFALARYNLDGSPDSTFGEGGKQTTSFGGNDYGNDRAYNAAIQNNGKIIVTGFTEDIPFLVRYNTDGSPDSAFNGDGQEITGYSVSVGSSQKIAIQTDDKIVMVNNILNGKNSDDFAVARFNANGGPDTTFSGDGKLTTDFNHSNDDANTLAIEKDGKIVVAGSVLNGNVYFVGIAKYNSDGSIDSTFGVDGRSVGNELTAYRSAAIQKNGKVVAAGYTWNGNNFEFVVARYTIRGNLDTTFAGGGIKTTSFGNGGISSVAIQDDGKIVVTSSVTVARYDTDGGPDSTFGKGGQKTIDFGGRNDISTSLVIQKDGKIIVAGNSDGKFAIARYNTDGSADNSFNGNGKQIISMRFADTLKSVALQSDGKILMGGSTYNGAGYDSDYFAITRLNINGTIDKSFATNGKKIGSFGYRGSYINSVAIESEGKIIVAGNIFGGQPLKGFALARFTKEGMPDSTFGKTGIVIPDHDIFSQANSVAIEDNGKILVGGSCGNHSAITCINSDGTPDSIFGDNGRQIVHLSQQADIIYNIAVDYNKLYAVGTTDVLGTLGTVIKFLLNAANTPPAISLTASVDSAHAGANIRLNAISTDKDGTISKVEFYNGTTLLHTEYQVRYDYKWQNVPEGNYALTAKAYDNNGLTTTSDTVHISIVNVAPIVNIISPVNGATYIAGPRSVILRADVSDPDGYVKKVFFYDQIEGLIAFTGGSPFSYAAWYRPKPGTYTITAVAYDNNWKATASSPVTVTITPPEPAIVNITSPVNGGSYVSPATIILSADARDSDGTIKSVKFYSGETLIGTEENPPYYRNWNHVPAGNYTITARAIDNDGNKTVSAPVTVTVTSPGALFTGRPSSGDISTNVNEVLSMQLLPNPVRNILNINITGLQKSNRVTISVITASGVVIKTVQTNSISSPRQPPGHGLIQLDVSSLAGGMYIIKVISEDKVMYKEFVKL